MSTETKTLTNADAKIQPKLGVKALVQIGMLSAIAIILMMFEIPLPFAPTFYKIDLSEVPVLVGCFAMGPWAGAMIELIKILLNLGPMAGVLVELVKILLNFVMTGTSTAGVGEIANFIIGCSFCVPAGLIYRKNRTRKSALIGMATGTLLMIVIGCFVNGFVLLPTYAKAFGMPIDALVGMGTAVNSHITSLSTFVMFAVAPFNLVKGIVVSLVVFLIYKKISPIFRIR